MPTITDLQRAVLTLAASQIGEGEHPPGSNCTKYGVWFGLNCVAWCCEFVSWVESSCRLPAHQASVGYRVEEMRKRGRFHGPHETPQPGWEVYFDWRGDGWGDHIGFVEKVIPGGVQTIEGNTENVVARRTRTQYILGYGDPYPPPPSTGGFLMALTDKEQQEVLAAARVVKNEVAREEGSTTLYQAVTHEVDTPRGKRAMKDFNKLWEQVQELDSKLDRIIKKVGA